MHKMTREICRIAIPSVVETLFTTLVSMIDSKMVSQLGISAISAVSVTNQPRLFVLCLFFAVNTTVSALTARKIGSKDREGANRLLLTALLAVTVMGLAVGLLCVLLAEPVMILCSNQPDTLADSALYFRIIMGGMLFNVLFMTVNAALRGCGRTRTTLVTNIVSCSVNILLNYMLIQGNWGAPALGIKGAAIATVAGTVVAAVIGFALICRESGFISLAFCRRQKLRPSMACIGEMQGMWKKIFTENLFTRVGFLLTGIIAARTGSFAMSVYSVGMHLMNVNFALGSGLQSAAVALVGRSWGAEQTDQARDCCRRILRLGLWASLVLSALFIALGRPYYRFFGQEESFIRAGMISCVIIGLISPIQTQQIVYNGIFQGTGDVRYTLYAAVVSVTLVNTAVSFVVANLLGAGLWGIWAGAFACQAVRMLMLRSRYRKKFEKTEVTADE